MAASTLMPYLARNWSTLPCSIKRSGQPMRTTERFDLHVAQCFQNGAAKSAHQDMIFESNDHARAASVLGEYVAIQRFHEAGVDHGGGKALLPELRGELLRHRQQGSQPERLPHRRRR